MSSKNYLDKDGLLYYNEKLKAIINNKANASDVTALTTRVGTNENNIAALQSGKVDKITGMGLSHNDLTDALVEKINASGTASSYADLPDKPSINSVTLSGNKTAADLSLATAAEVSTKAEQTDLNTTNSNLSNLTTTVGTKANQSEVDTLTTTVNGKANRNEIITTTSGLTNDANFQTGSEVSASISAAIAGVTQFDYEIVEELPEEGVKGTIYLVLYAEGTEGDVYQEFIWIDGDPEGSFETLGFTNEIDLSDYVKNEDLVNITNAEIDAMFSNNQNE